MQNILSQLQKSNISLSLAQLEGLLYLIASNKLTNTGLIQSTGLPKETLKVFKETISFMLSDNKNENILLKLEFSQQLKDLNLKPFKWSLLDYSSDPRTQVLADFIDDIRSKYLTAPANRELDQFYATASTTAAKVLMLVDKGLIDNKNIALLGDDDLVSIVLGIFFKTVNLITVFEIDDSLCTVLEAIISDLGIKNVRINRYDARNSLRNQDIKNFDVVIIDPPYTKSGVSLFLARAVSMLKPVNDQDLVGKYIFLYYGNSPKSPEKFIKLQELINKNNLVIEDKLANFAHYLGAESIGSASSLYILRATPFVGYATELVVNPNIYTFENQKDEKFPFVDHWVFKVFNVASETLKSKTAISNVAGKFCNLHKLKVVDQKITSFKKQGYSLTFILASSNLLIHTWPEYNALHIDLITCSPIYNREEMQKTLSELFKTKIIEASNIE